MSQNDISKYFTKQNGSAITNDTEFAGLATHTVIKNNNSGLTFKKVGATVFDKTPIEVETDAVLYTQQSLTNSQKTQARKNIGAISSNDTQTLINSVLSVESTGNPYGSALTIGNFRVNAGKAIGKGQTVCPDSDCWLVSYRLPFIIKNDYPPSVVLTTESSPDLTGDGAECKTGLCYRRVSPRYHLAKCEDGSGHSVRTLNYVAIGTPFTYNSVTSLLGDPGNTVYIINFNPNRDIPVIIDIFIPSDFTGSVTISNVEQFNSEDTLSISDSDYDVGVDSFISGTEWRQRIEGYTSSEIVSLSGYKMRSFCCKLMPTSYPVFTKSGTGTPKYRILYTSADGSSHTGSGSSSSSSGSGSSSSSGTSGGSSSSGNSSSSGQTWGTVKYRDNVALGDVTSHSYTVGTVVPEGTVVRVFNVSHVTMGGTGPIYGNTDQYYIWKANGHTLTSAEKSAINAETGGTGASVGGVPWAITYDSGSV